MSTVIEPLKDPMGQAISDFHDNKPLESLIVGLDITEKEEFPIPHLFRTYKKMPVLEQKALDLCVGNVLDVGAGAGAHSLYLQEKGFDVKAIDVSQLSCDTMRKRGIKNVELIDFYSLANQKYDTILFLMNGIGLVKTVDNFPSFFKQLDQLLSPDGFALLDSSDLRYMFEDEKGQVWIDLNGKYYGEVVYELQYGKVKGDPFSWLFIDFGILEMYAKQNGFVCERIEEGEHYNYLAKLSKA